MEAEVYIIIIFSSSGQALYLYLGDMIPKLKSRQSGGGGSQSSTQQQQGSKSQKKKDRKGRK